MLTPLIVPGSSFIFLTEWGSSNDRIAIRFGPRCANMTDGSLRINKIQQQQQKTTVYLSSFGDWFDEVARIESVAHR